MKHFYVVELNAFRPICNDVSFWTHGADNIKALEEFVEQMLTPSQDWSNFVLLRLKFTLFTKMDKLFQFDSFWASSEMEHHLPDNNTWGHSSFSFDSINRSLGWISHFQQKKNKEEIQKNQELLKESYQKLWNEVELKLVPTKVKKPTKRNRK